MSSHKQIDVTQDIMQQLPGEVVAHIASFTEKKDLNNLRLASSDAAAKSSIEFAKQNLKHLHVNIRIQDDDSTDFGRFDLSDIEDALKIIEDNNRASFVEEVTFGDNLDWDSTPYISPDQVFGSREMTKTRTLLMTLFSKLTSIRKVSFAFNFEPFTDFLMRALEDSKHLQLTSLNLCHGGLMHAYDLSQVLRTFSKTLRSLHLHNHSLRWNEWQAILENVRDDLQIEEFSIKSAIVKQSMYHPNLLDFKASSNDHDPDLPEGESYCFEWDSVVMVGKTAVKRSTQMLLIMLPGY
ncbi:uncharacterized protein RHO25_000337 [Cercospora beticola]|nr:hypothetical protein RHO25_000337 [Cercospora beticola]